MTAPKVVRASKFRHVFGVGSKRDECYEGAQVSLDSNDYHLVKSNGKFMSIHWDAAGGGAFLVHPLEKSGRLPTGNEVPLFTGHSGAVLDTDWHPFNEHVLASAGEDGRVLVWNVPEGGPTLEAIKDKGANRPAGELKGHDRRIVNLAWHPAAEGVLASASHDLTIRIWDVIKAAARQTLIGHGDAVLDQAWSLDGTRLVSSCRDKTVRVFDPRGCEKAACQFMAHNGIKGTRVAWIGDKVLTTGFGRGSEREIALWDPRNSSTALHLLSVDTASGPLLPYYDPDCNLLYVAGRGDGNIRYYEIVTGETNPFFALSEYKSTDPQRALALLPKRIVNTAENEIARFIKIYGSQSILEPISFKVPRRDGGGFASDLYPNAIDTRPAMTSEEYWSGKSAVPSRSSLRTAASESNLPIKEIKVEKTEEPSIDLEPQGEEALRESWRVLKKENERLHQELAQKTIQIRQLESRQ